MCGRYALGIRASFVRYQLQQQGLQVDDAPDDDVARETYNFPPGSFGLVYRAEVPDSGLRDNEEAPSNHNHDPSTQTTDDDTAKTVTAPEAQSDSNRQQFKYELKAMKWGLIPFWTKRSPDYSSMLRTINCRDDSLSQSSGLWTTMKARKRCLVIAQGFYEWLKKGPPGSKQEKIPHFVKRKDGQLMCMAGLWDCVHYEDSPPEEKLYTYTVITTDSNQQLSFLHDRMPVILDPNTEAMNLWLDPTANKWSDNLQKILQPFTGELECYPVNKDVGKVGNNDPSFIIPIDSKENKKNIANFFGNVKTKNEESPKKPVPEKAETAVSSRTGGEIDVKIEDTRFTIDSSTTETHAPLPIPPPSQGGTKRKADTHDEAGAEADQHTEKQLKLEFSPETKPAVQPTSPPEKKTAYNSSTKMSTSSRSATARKTRSAISNEGVSKKPSPVKADASQRITSFFGSKECG